MKDGDQQTDPAAAPSLWHLADFEELSGDSTRERWSSVHDDRELRVVTTTRRLVDLHLALRCAGRVPLASHRDTSVSTEWRATNGR